MRDRGGGQPVAVVSYFHGQLPAAPVVWLDAGRHGHRRAAMTHGVADKVGEDDIEAAAVHPCGQAGRHVRAHAGPAPRPQAAADGVRDIGFVGHELRGTSIEAGDLDEVLHQPVEVLHLLPDQPRGRRGVPGQSRVLVEYADHRRHRRQRSPQLMGHIAGEPPGPGLHPLQLTHLVLQGGSHPVERGDQLGELVPAPRLDPDRQVTAGYALRGPGQPPDGQQHPAGSSDGGSGDHRKQQPSRHPEEDQGGMAHQVGRWLAGIGMHQALKPARPKDHIVQPGGEAIGRYQGMEP
jgi:hypothetical protein